MANENVHAGHRRRLRERAAKEGFASFNPHQVIELLLFNAVVQKDTSEMAHQLVNKFKTVQNVLTAPKEELMTIKGVGPKVADWLNRVGELVQSYGELRDTDRPCLRNYRDVLRFAEQMGKKMPAPSCYYLALTPSGTLLHFARMCSSLSWGVPEALKRCINGMLTVHARSVIVIEFVGSQPVCEEDYEVNLAKLFAQTVNVMGAEWFENPFLYSWRSPGTKP